ncbi:MAG: hypothetical protein ACI9RY_001596 [Reinekea sp.]|jgi:hypothetical protein
MKRHQLNNSYPRSSYRAPARNRLLSRLTHSMLMLVVVVAAVMGGLWLLGLGISLVVGLFTLVISLVPLVFIAWLVWRMVRAMV